MAIPTQVGAASRTATRAGAPRPDIILLDEEWNACRLEASLFTSHPAPGRRHQVLAARPEVAASVVMSGADSVALDAEIGPYAEALRRRINAVYEL